MTRSHLISDFWRRIGQGNESLDGSRVCGTGLGRCSPRQTSENTDGTINGEADGEHSRSLRRLERNLCGLPLSQQRRGVVGRHPGSALRTHPRTHAGPSGRAVAVYTRNDRTRFQWPRSAGTWVAELTSTARHVPATNLCRDASARAARRARRLDVGAREARQRRRAPRSD